MAAKCRMKTFCLMLQSSSVVNGRWTDGDKHTSMLYIMTYCSRWELILQEHKGYCYPASALYCTPCLETHCTQSYMHTLLANFMTVSGKINRDFLPHLSLVPLNQSTHGNAQTHTPMHANAVSATVCFEAILRIHIKSCRNSVAFASPTGSKLYWKCQYRPAEYRPQRAKASSESVVKAKRTSNNSIWDHI